MPLAAKKSLLKVTDEFPTENRKESSIVTELQKPCSIQD